MRIIAAARARPLRTSTSMPRRRRTAGGGLFFHVVNRGARKGLLFDTDADFQAFERLLVEAVRRFDVAVLSYCLMPNHWHLIIFAPASRTMSRFMHWLTTTHARRWRHTHHTDGEGAVYQGRFKAIPIAADGHFLWVCRYVERNACRALLVERAEDWKWSSLWQRQHNSDATWLAAWPVERPENWSERLNVPQTEAELEVFRETVRSDQPFGDADWRTQVTDGGARLLRHPRGRPRRAQSSEAVSSKNDSRPHF